MSFIESFLAQIFDKFKASNPKIATIIIFILGVFIYAIQNGLPELIGTDLTKVLEWVVFVLAALTGSRTYNYLPKDDKK
jgi:hypothetical protein